jgi:glycosyltransferase involved in cell wall biosynthesis
VVHNGLNAASYPASPNRRYNERFQIPRGAPLVGIIGVLARWKGQPEFIQMARAMIESGSAAHFVVIGDEIYDTGSDRGYGTSLRELARGLEGRLHFAGYETDPAVAIGGLDVLVHASIRPEPFGRVVIEGMACEVPVVCAAAGGVLEVVKDRTTGLLFPPGDVNAMGRAVGELISDPGLRRRLARAGREEFLDRFTRERHVEQIVALYRSILSEASGRARGRNRPSSDE